MGEHEKFLASLVAKLDDLRAERKALDDKIAALELTYETMTGDCAPSAAGLSPAKAPRKARKSPKPGHTKDAKALEKTLASLQARKRPASIDAIASEFGVSANVAGTRLARLVKLGWAVRASRGKYLAKEGAAPEASA